ncbi:uncharacterized protein [Apostichopus japonicus]|uniref:uncharacterized protein n=1 Tax=Stichopus japonicus TaxID=307972 RepID=UPI003AB647F8
MLLGVACTLIKAKYWSAILQGLALYCANFQIWPSFLSQFTLSLIFGMFDVNLFWVLVVSLSSVNMAQPAQRLRVTDFLPTRFCGDRIDSDWCRAHFYTFVYYLEAHDLHEPADQAELHNVVQLFKRSLQGTARLWIERKVFETLQDLQTVFVDRFSPSQSQFAYVTQFENITYIFLGKVLSNTYPKSVNLKRNRIETCTSNPPNPNKHSVFLCQEVGISARTQSFFYLQDEKASKEVSFSAREVAPAPNSAIYDEIYAQLKDQLQTLNMARGEFREPRKLQRDSTPNHNRSNSPSVNRGGKSPNRRTSGSHNNLRKDTGRYYRRKTFCDYCLYPGHTWRNCRKRQRDL